MGQPTLILASASPRRRELIARLGVEPAAINPADIDETPHTDELPRDYARRMAREKAEAAASDDGHVLAGDTVVCAGRRILPKAEDEATARRCLELLSGRRHRVLTAVAVRHHGRLRERLVETVVRMRPISDDDLSRYLALGDWRGKAGGYAIQGAAAAFIPWIQGSFSAVVGLPLAETATMLAACGIHPDPPGDRP